jgi:hypothetical protein
MWSAHTSRRSSVAQPRFCLSRGLSIIVVEHAAQTLTASEPPAISGMRVIRDNQPVVQTLVVSFAVIMRHKFGNPLRNELSPIQIMRSKQDSLMLRTNLSAWALRLGERGGSFTDFTRLYRDSEYTSRAGIY